MPMAVRSVSYGAPIVDISVSPGLSAANMALAMAWVPFTKPMRTRALSAPKTRAQTLSSVSRPRSS